MSDQAGFDFAAGASECLLNDHGELWYWPDWLASQQADAGFAQLLEELPWTQHYVRVYDKRHACPRLSAWIGDGSYAYSGQRYPASDWHPLLAQWRDALADTLEAPFNSVLANLYRDGDDAMGWHADNERELGPAPTIASISLGAARDFAIRRRQSSRQHACVRLEHGSLLCMRGAFQQHWQHQLPRRKRCNDARINLTFRWVSPQAD